jgi:hypothetical protein
MLYIILLIDSPSNKFSKWSLGHIVNETPGLLNDKTHRKATQFRGK